MLNGPASKSNEPTSRSNKPTYKIDLLLRVMDLAIRIIYSEPAFFIRWFKTRMSRGVNSGLNWVAMARQGLIMTYFG